MTKDQLTKLITEVLGERCPEHHEQCMTCAAWWMFDRLSDEPSGERLTHVEHRLVRAEAEILRLGAKALDTEYMKEFPEPYIPGSPLNRRGDA